LIYGVDELNNNMEPILYIVHCIDTEGPLIEDLADTFVRIKSIYGVSLTPSYKTLMSLQKREIDLGGAEVAISKIVSPELLKYNESWADIRKMLDGAMSSVFRNKMKDDFGGGWVYSWHCMDHVGYSDNPRRKDIGFGNVFRFYRDAIREKNSVHDEINWHFHPLSFSRNPLQCATSYVNSYDVLIQILARRVIDECWFPVVNRPGFHSERPDSHLFLEQWIPYDYANQFYEHQDDIEQLDITEGRLGDWRWAPSTWRGYHPHHDNYQQEGHCRRVIFRCLNVGTRVNSLEKKHFHQAFDEAEKHGSAILAFADHDYRDVKKDVDFVRNMLLKIKKSYPSVRICFSGAANAARQHIYLMEGRNDDRLELKVVLDGNKLLVSIISGSVFGPQPFLAIKSKSGEYFHDNFDISIPGKQWSYTFDEQTIVIEIIEVIGVAAVGSDGYPVVERLFSKNKFSAK